MSLKLQGVIVPAITPRKNDRVDLASMRKLIDFLIDGEVDAIFILGTTGEFRKMVLPEKLAVIESAAKHTRNRVPILTGISAEEFDETLALIKKSEACGIDALVLAPMYGETEARRQIGQTIERTAVPVILYNNPAIHGGQNLPLEIVEEFAGHPQIISMKDSSGDEDYFQKLLKLNSDDFKVIQGKEALILTSLQNGSPGFVAGMANITPEVCKRLWLERDQHTMDTVMSIKSTIKNAFPDSITGYKTKLVELGIIESDQRF